MLRHLLMFKLKNQALGKSQAENLKMLQSALNALPALIPEILHWEVAINVAKSPSSADLLLDSSFEDAAALERYRVHPEHQKVVELIEQICEERRVVDYEK